MSLFDDDAIDQELATYETFSAIDFTDDKEFSKTELQIIRAQYPINVDEDQIEEITVNGKSGVWINRTEVNEWQGKFKLKNINSYLVFNARFLKSFHFF